MFERKIKEFKCWGVTKNTNSFGLRQFRLLSRKGEFFTVLGNQSFADKVKLGSVVNVEILNKDPQWAKLGVEIPQRHSPDAPKPVIDEVWSLKTPV